MDLGHVEVLTERLAKLGQKNRDIPSFYDIEPFKHFHSNDGKLKTDELDEYDGKFSRREILTRYLLVNVVLDQGPDMAGVGEL